MTKEDKILLLIDLCTRLPYYTMVLMGDGAIELLINVNVDTFICNGLKGLPKPYLRPMSSMTEEEKKELYHYYCKEIADNLNTPNLTWELICCVSNSFGTDWLNARHFDYRGLIEKGLALEAPEGMYKTE